LELVLAHEGGVDGLALTERGDRLKEAAARLVIQADAS